MHYVRKTIRTFLERSLFELPTQKAMRTMFVAQENCTKRFQKPNILRKRAKVSPKPNAAATSESPGGLNLVTACRPDQMFLSKKPVQKSTLDNDSQTTLDVESFLNNVVPVGVNDNINSSNKQHNELNDTVKEQWCLDFINNAQEIIIEDIDGSQLGSLRVASAPTATHDVVSISPPGLTTDSIPTMPVQNLTLEYLASSTMNFKCDVPDCNKRFRSAQKFNKHKLVHENGPKVVRQTISECPAVKDSINGVVEPCGVLCISKEELIAHLNQDHNSEDAMYVCTECGRRFFWASGLRAHARAHWRAGALACAWPGCGRAFRQPCRLREHMRAHTGDKPYPCRHPNCGWSFRSASKLMRHALRHTGERRHPCAACGRAFRRREHLRDHTARQHRPRAACERPGCKKKFTNLEALNIHMEAVHKQDYVNTIAAEIEPLPAEATEEAVEISLPEPEPGAEEEAFLVSLSPAVDASLAAHPEACHAARTHCTWPLGPRAAPPAPDGLEEDAQVELSEGSESNIYTIRSDLFLHGNVLNNEDSEQMAGPEPGGALPAADAHLSLLDAHPTIDLMQEELMYTDSAVDESSFRVFLLSGEELS